MSGLLQDLRLAVRAWSRIPGVALAAVLTLALGIGVTSAVYSIGNMLLWRALPYPGSDRLTVIYGRTADGGEYEDYAWSELDDFRAGTAEVLSGVAGITPVSVGLAEEGAPAVRVWGEMVSANYFALLRAPMALGRGFAAAEDSAGAPPAVVLSHALWRTRFHGDAAILGRTVRLNRREFTVVGVAAADFATPYYVGFSPTLWVPSGAHAVVHPGRGALDAQGEESVRLVARLADGATLSGAQAVVGLVGRRLAADHAADYAGREAVLLLERSARPEPHLAGGFTLALRLFLAVAGLVLLIACANVASLLLARALARRREIAVRVALGASRSRLVRQLLVESLLLALGGGALGLLVGSWLTAGLSRLLTLPTDIPFVFAFALDQRVIGFTALVTLGTTLAFGLAPALQATAPGIAGALRHDSVGWRGVSRSRLRDGLVVAQLAVACLLLTGAALVTRSLRAMQDAALGYDPRNVLLVSIAPGLTGYDAARTRALYREAVARLAAMPGVASATAAEGLPMDFTSNGGTIVAEGGEAPTPERPGEPAGWTIVGDNYFSTLGTPLLEGRDFGPGDTVGSLPVAVVSRVLATRLWPGQPAVGKVLRFGDLTGPAVTVIGVAADAKYRLITEGPRSHLYLPLAQDDAGAATLVVRTDADPRGALAAVRVTLANLDPDLPIAESRTMDELLAGRALLFSRIATTLAGTLGILALALSVVGLYGVVTYAVAQRTRELGIRLALGATSGGVLRLVLGDGLRLAATGIGMGFLLALVAGRLIRGFLYEVSPLDPVALTGTAVILAAVTLLASAIPAFRAGRVHPMTALRAE